VNAAASTTPPLVVAISSMVSMARVGITYLAANRHVLVVLAYRDLLGLNAWPASGRDPATYNEGNADG